MSNKVSSSEVFNKLEENLLLIASQVEQMQKYLSNSRSAAIPHSVYDATFSFASLLPQAKSLVNTLEEERQGYRALAQIGQVINSSLDLDVVLQIVMDTMIQLTGAERGFLMLRDDRDHLVIRIARNWEQETIDESERLVSSTVINKVTAEAKSVLTTNAQEDPRFYKQDSIVALNIRSILCVPLKLKGEVTGVIYADNRVKSGLFTMNDLDMLTSFANHAAVAIENAHLFASVRQTLAEVTELKNLMDNVFSSIASGVLTANTQEQITLCNRAAETILGKTSNNMLGQNLKQAISSFSFLLAPHFEKVLETDEEVTGLEGSTILPGRGKVDLRFNLSPLKDFQQSTQGVAIVVEDLTDQKRLESQRRLFSRMVSPAVIDQIDPERIQLGGVRSNITILFADIRGFTSLSERIPPEELVRLLNIYLRTAVDAILSYGGTIDKFLGDAVMAWFNAPLPQPDHEIRAIQAALSIRSTLHTMQENNPEGYGLDFGMGVHCGEAILGLIGTEQRLEYTAIGDAVNTAKRIQEHSEPGQILISEAVHEKVGKSFDIEPCEAIKAKGKKELIQIYQVIGSR